MPSQSRTNLPKEADTPRPKCELNRSRSPPSRFSTKARLLPRSRHFRQPHPGQLSPAPLTAGSTPEPAKGRRATQAARSCARFGPVEVSGSPEIGFTIRRDACQNVVVLNGSPKWLLREASPNSPTPQPKPINATVVVGAGICNLDSHILAVGGADGGADGEAEVGRSRRFDAVFRPLLLDFGLISVDLARSMDAFAHATAWGVG